MQSFGKNLLQFAQTVDSLHQEVINNMKEVTSDYFLRKDGLGASYFCVSRPGAFFEGVETLSTIWSSEQNLEEQIVRRYKDKSGTGSPNLRALSYNEDRCLWITTNPTSEDSKDVTLDKTTVENLVNQWPKNTSKDEQLLPHYDSSNNNPCRTLVSLPLKHGGKTLGVLVIEFSRMIPITEAAQIEVKLFQEALGRILWLEDAAKSQVERKLKAFDSLRSAVSTCISSVDLPKLFFAFPTNSDPAVVASIKRLMDEEYTDRLALLAWDEMDRPGSITDNLVEDILRCRYGISYLSESAEFTEEAQNDCRYIDNSNVLIESGMLQILTMSKLTSFEAWIPIREGEGEGEGETNDRIDSVPFDFKQVRMIKVPRGSADVLLCDEFVEILKKRIDAMLDL